METGSILTQALGSIAAGGVSFLGAFLRFKQRLQVCEDALKLLALEVPKLRAGVTEAKLHYEALSGGWRLEFNQLQSEFNTEMRHKRELEEALRADRASRPDPLEDVREDLHRLRQEIEKLKERGGRYVRSDAFAAFTKAQEDQWKEMQRTLGRLEHLLK